MSDFRQVLVILMSKERGVTRKGSIENRRIKRFQTHILVFIQINYLNEVCCTVQSSYVCVSQTVVVEGLISGS